MERLIQIGFVACTLICLGLILFGLRQVLDHSGFESTRQRKIFGGVLGSLVVWLMVLSALSLTGFLGDFSKMPPRMFIVLVVPLLTISFLLSRPTVNAILGSTPGAWLIYIQSFRVIVELLLWMMFLDGTVPIQMTFEGRNFDVLAGLSAPLAGYLVFEKKIWPGHILVVWNLAGLGLLINIVTIAVLSMPTPFRVFMNDPANTIVACFPYVWLPGVLVVIAYSMHLLSLKQLLLKKSDQ